MPVFRSRVDASLLEDCLDTELKRESCKPKCWCQCNFLANISGTKWSSTNSVKIPVCPGTISCRGEYFLFYTSSPALWQLVQIYELNHSRAVVILMNSDLKSVPPIHPKESKLPYTYPQKTSEKSTMYPNKPVSTYPNTHKSSGYAQKPAVSTVYPPKHSSGVGYHPADKPTPSFLDLNKQQQMSSARHGYNQKSTSNASSYQEKPAASTSSYPQRATAEYPQNMKSASQLTTTYPSNKSSYHEKVPLSAAYPIKTGSEYAKRDPYGGNPSKSRQLASSGKSIYPSKQSTSSSSSSSSSSAAVDYSVYQPQVDATSKVGVMFGLQCLTTSSTAEWWRLADRIILLSSWWYIQRWSWVWSVK